MISINVRNTTKIEEGKGKLITLNVEMPECAGRLGLYSMKDGETREALRKIFKQDTNYTFIRTVMNPEAAELIGNNEVELVKIRLGRYDDDCRIRFDADLMDVYIAALDHLVKNRKIKHVHYSSVQTDGVHNSRRHPDAPLWPIIHVVQDKADNIAQFAALCTQLNSEEAYEFIKEKEAPQNYKMGSVDLLRKEGVEPLKLEDRVWRPDSEALRDASDFLLHFTHVYKRFNRRDIDD